MSSTVSGDFPDWFDRYLQSRRRLKKSPHTLAAIRSDFTVIGRHLAAGAPLGQLGVERLTGRRLEAAFARYADDYAANSYLRARSTWMQLCQWLANQQLIVGPSPMRNVEAVKPESGPPKSLTFDQFQDLLGAVDQVNAPPQSWPELEKAIILLGVLAGPREAELRALNIGDIRMSEQGPVLHIHGKGNKRRQVPVEVAALAILGSYLQTRERLFGATRRRGDPEEPLTRFAPTDPLFVGSDGQRLTRGSMQYRMVRAFSRAGITRPEGALMHTLRHSYATALADAGIDTYKLRALLGHESLNSTQRYIAAAGQDHRSAAAANSLYRLVNEPE
ncbi:tyrosine-type recombinase/integrase [Gordonia phosphorivorans]|uniref:Tyrosine-type recombinase/integrase n=1 Tax=Gordonia phosphorivorans TaxID=1056982 RepID=A0ABV6H423_9ACTN